VPALAAPLDLKPRASVVSLKVPKGVDWAGGSLRVELPAGAREITLRNNAVGL
jgi:hypothetical protein